MNFYGPNTFLEKKLLVFLPAFISTDNILFDFGILQQESVMICVSNMAE